MFHSRAFAAGTLSNWPVYAVKAGVSAFLARQFCLWTGIDDPVSAAFVAVIAASPTLYTGLRSSLWQIAGSLVGGLIAIGVLLLVPSQGWALALAVGLAVILTGPLLGGDAHIVAAFTALYVVLLSNGDSAVRYEHRLGGVLLGSASAFLVNFSATAMMYEKVFRRRMALADLAVESVLRSGLSGRALFDVEALLHRLESELRDAGRDLRLFSRFTRTLVQHFQKECASLLSVLAEFRVIETLEPDRALAAGVLAADFLIGSDRGQKGSVELPVRMRVAIEMRHALARLRPQR